MICGGAPLRILGAWFASPLGVGSSVLYKQLITKLQDEIKALQLCQNKVSSGEYRWRISTLRRAT